MRKHGTVVCNTMRQDLTTSESYLEHRCFIFCPEDNIRNTTFMLHSALPELCCQRSAFLNIVTFHSGKFKPGTTIFLDEPVLFIYLFFSFFCLLPSVLASRCIIRMASFK